MVRKKEFAATVFNPNIKTLVVYVVFFASSNFDLEVYPFWQTQIVSLIVDKPFISVFFKYTNFINIFSKDLAAKLLKYIRINNHAIDLVKNQQPPYETIYSLKLMKLEILKIYIEIYLSNSFINMCKSPATTFVLFVSKPNKSF